MAHGGGLPENSTATTADRDDDTEPNREGKGVVRHRKLTTETQEWSARSERLEATGIEEEGRAV